jgi:small-conductance mechanosensitive channel
MRQIIVSELDQAMQELIRGAAHVLPRIVVLLIIVLIGWVLAALLRAFLRSILRLIQFDKLSANSGASDLLTKAALPPASELVSRFVFWLAWLGLILLGANVLGIFGLQEEFARFFFYLPRLFVALFTLFFGLLAASFFSRAALLAAVNSNSPSPRLMSVAARVVIIIFVLSMVFEELGVAQQTMILAFGIAFGALMFGLAIAFGLGGQDLARKFLESKFLHAKRSKEKEDELSPL